MQKSINKTSAWKNIVLETASVLVAVVLTGTASAQIAPTFPALLNSNATTDSGRDNFPSVAADASGNVVAVWQSTEALNGAGTDLDIFVSRSADHGVTWTPPALLNSYAIPNSKSDYGPKVVTDTSGTWVAMWISKANRGGAGTDPDVFFARSTDNGATWSAAVPMSSYASTNAGEDFQIDLATDGTGNWCAIWSSKATLIGFGNIMVADIVVSRSADNGATWSLPIELGNVGAHSRIAADASGNWVAVWDSLENLDGSGGDADVIVSHSADNGATWSAPALLNDNAIGDSATDASPQVSSDGNGGWVVLWISDDPILGTGPDIDIFMSHSTDDGANWTPMAPYSDAAITDAMITDEEWLELSSDGTGNMVVAWRSRWEEFGTGSDDDIIMAHSRDNGQTWSAPVIVNANATIDGRDDFTPQFAADGMGNWVAVWQSSEDLNNAGTDSDIFFATFTLPPVIRDIKSSVPPGLIVEGANLRLTAPPGANYEWRRDGIPLADDPPRVTGTDTQFLRFQSISLLDEGEYTVSYDVTELNIRDESDPLLITVQLPNSLPAAGTVTLLTMALALLVLSWKALKPRKS